MTETAAQGATPTQSYGNFGLSFPGRLPLCGPVATDVVDVKLLGIPMRRWCRLLVVWELVDAEHDLHGIAGGLPDGLDQPVVDEEGHMLGRPFGRVDVELAGVYVEDFHGELVADGWVAKWMQPHADAHMAGCHVSSEDLTNADLRRPVGLVLKADHTQSDHAAAAVDGL